MVKVSPQGELYHPIEKCTVCNGSHDEPCNPGTERYVCFLVTLAKSMERLNAV